MNNLLNIFIITFISGVIGTGFGGIIGALFKKDSKQIISLLLGFAGGVMIGIVCFDLLQDSIHPTDDRKINIFLIIVGLLLGYMLVYLINYLINQKTSSFIKTNDKSLSSLVIAGIIMVCAIAIHNIPEGMIIGASASISNTAFDKAVIVMAILIGLHNIPEGMAISVPLIGGGMKKIRAVLLTALSGLPTVFGAFIGYFIGDIGPVGLSMSLSFASGAMLYVVFGEIIPEALLIYKSKIVAVSIICGIITSLIIVYI